MFPRHATASCWVARTIEGCRNGTVTELILRENGALLGGKEAGG
jgi:hypothetical protein